ncbi:hypothetical protein FNV43_RR02372 [Rhamnella rubrinervis]|uniref:Uncharacterized protein n=1 Tax=Rhamnella rubrinervis TaxID=2594499 RepID=A0A8K0MTN6_9ROSA|nr:hypothetical protein FNV43_RR02372 [Rhamnella rubrinervis]
MRAWLMLFGWSYRRRFMLAWLGNKLSFNTLLTSYVSLWFEVSCDMLLSYSRDVYMDYRWVIAPMDMCSKDDPIVVNDSEELDQEDELEVNKHKWDAAFDVMLNKEQQVLVWEYVCGFRDALPFKEGEPLPAWFTSEEDYKKE